MKDIKVYPCANGASCEVAYDERDDVCVVSQKGEALGWFKLSDIKKKEEYKNNA